MSLRPAWVVLALSLVLVVGRSLMAAQSALVVAGVKNSRLAAAQVDPAVAAVAHQDSLLRNAPGSSRDPFRAWQAPSGEVARTAGRPQPEPVAPPRVSVYLDDGATRLVQIEVDGETSGRLAVGGSFRGWAVTGITPGGVIVIKNGQRFVLPRP